jgi:hypothetical protein
LPLLQVRNSQVAVSGGITQQSQFWFGSQTGVGSGGGGVGFTTHPFAGSVHS